MENIHYILDGALMTDRAQAHAYIAETLSFPPYYGGNLDALADCLSDLSARTRITLVNGERLRENLGAYADRLLEVFRQTSAAPGAFGFDCI